MIPKRLYDACNDMDDKLIMARGLLEALDRVLEAHPHMGGSDQESVTVFAVLRSLRERIKEADATMSEVWDAARNWDKPEEAQAA